MNEIPFYSFSCVADWRCNCKVLYPKSVTGFQNTLNVKHDATSVSPLDRNLQTSLTLRLETINPVSEY